MKKIGILTGGADCPGLNSVIRVVVRKAMHEGYVVTGIKNGWMGLVENDMKVLDLRQTSGILDRGGTILGTSRLVPPLASEKMKIIAENFKRSGMDALIAIGGEDTLKIALALHKQKQIPVVGVPKSIDNSLSGTDYTFGFDTAVNVATECIDRLHTTAESHHRIIVIEVMGRYTGWIALEAGIAGGADIILIPEYSVKIDEICDALKARHERGKTFSIIVVSEGAMIEGYEAQLESEEKLRRHRVGTVCELIANLIEEKTGFETKVSVLGHIQRGGSPTAYDRIIGTRFGYKAVELIIEKKFGHMVSLQGNSVGSVKIEDAVKHIKQIDPDLYDIARIFSASVE
ncbi:MAG TPA: ATP-dependent 6-phosphofructokinase [Candidatus Omnitrophota bacterium]|nr:ATP-dependent 6-phosphofructokinase [Candidatus Omnitrophota bacterium]